MSPVSLSLPAFGGTASVAVKTGDNCAWTVLPYDSVIVPAPPAGRPCPGSVSFSLPTNTSTTGLKGNLLVQNRLIPVLQAGASTARNNNSPGSAQAISAGFKTVWWKVTAPSGGALEVAAQGRRYDVAGDSGIVLTAYAADASPRVELGSAAVPRATGAGP